MEKSKKKECCLCPRNCKVSRENKEKGICGQDARLRVARAALHMWEEPCISGKRGSGTVFFSGCQLHCVFCQNGSIANGQAGKEITPERLAEIFLELEDKGANNINLVTPDHFVPWIIPALERARQQNMSLPVVYNTGSYVNTETLKKLEGLVDIYLPDMKYCGKDIAVRYANAPDYFEIAKAAIAEMVRQTNEPVFYRPNAIEKSINAEQYNEKSEDEEMLIKRGTIVRHLLLPGRIQDSQKILRYLIETYQNSIYISIMNQYTPMTDPGEYPELGRRVTPREYEKIIDFAIDCGVENGFIQQGKTALESFIPPFDETGV